MRLGFDHGKAEWLGFVRKDVPGSICWNFVYREGLRGRLGFAALDTKTKLYIQSILESNNNLKQNLLVVQKSLLNSNVEEHTRTRAFLQTSAPRNATIQREQLESETIEWFADTLAFPTMSDRREGISRAHSETF